MIWLLGSVVYGLCGLVCARMVAGHFAWQMAANSRAYNYATHRYEPRGRSPSGEQWFGAAMGGLGFGLVWPLVLLMVRLPMSRLAVGAEAEAIRRQQAERIRQLEEEAGIR